jgi:2-polyprenyl-3-methyl-5-hydroxy-6-metoxy-1,4-benzoquinol methylase
MDISINSAEWWNNEFVTKNNWETGIKGSIQTDMFAQITYALINPTIKNNISKIVDGEFIDFGCALGQATKMLRLLNNKVTISGVEISEEARVKAVENVDADVKIVESLKDSGDNCQLIYISNVLEHFGNPKDILNQLLNKSNNYIVVLSPYEMKTSNLNECEFKENTLKDLIWDKPEWKLIQQTIIGATDSFYNGTKQVLGIYKKIL